MKPKFEHVFIDMDGVLADFISASLGLFGCAHRGSKISGWDGMTKVVNDYGRQIGDITEQDFWNAIDDTGPEFWAHLPLMYGARALVDHVAESGCPFSLLTSPSRHPNSLAGKGTWIRRNFPEMNRKTIYTPQKHLLAAPGRLLIDDGDHNVTPWREHGGTALHWVAPPAEWRHNNIPNENDVDALLVSLRHMLR